MTERNNRQLLVWMFRFVRPVRVRAFLACLYLTLWIGADILVVRQTAVTINQIQLFHSLKDDAAEGFLSWIRRVDSTASGLRWQVSMLAALTAALVALSYLREVARGKLSMYMVYSIREAVYDRLQRAGFGFHDAYSSGELISRSFADLQIVREFIQSAVLLNLEIILIVSGYIALLLTRSPWVACLAVLPLPVWTWHILRFSKKIQPAVRAALEAGDKNVALITENLAGVHVVKAFGAEPQEVEKYNRHCEAYLNCVLRRIRLFANFTPLTRAIAAASHLSLFLVAGLMIIHGRLSVGDLLMLGSAMSAVLGRLQQVSVLNDLYQNAVVSARRLYEVITAPPSIEQREGARPLPPGAGAVSFENVTFGYDPAKPVLRNVTFRIPGGCVVAIVGPTGAGKTTLVHLLARFYDPQEGRILIDGMDLRDVVLESLRRQVAPVFQESYLFGDAVDANIAYGRPDLKISDIEAAGRAAQAHEFIEMMPSGYQTLLGDRGMTVSGGQRQRLAIARAIATNPRILILDDALAAVDPETEELIQVGTRSAMRGRTVFVVAHRISTVERADRVIVLEQGRVTQMGTHQELMEKEGHYRDIAELQLFGSRHGFAPAPSDSLDWYGRPREGRR